jgi:hypothetical protein
LNAHERRAVLWRGEEALAITGVKGAMVGELLQGITGLSRPWYLLLQMEFEVELR